MEVFSVLGLVAITAGGMISAFTARRPARLTMWLVAYVVLIEGLVQFGLAEGWQWLGSNHTAIAAAAFVVYNIGNGCVLLGTARKPRLSVLVNIGGILLAIAMLLLAWTIRNSVASWTLAWFAGLVLIIFISMPIGLILSARRKAA